MKLNNRGNSYQDRYPAFGWTAKTVIAAVAYSFALRLTNDDFEAAKKLCTDEWQILYSNGIVPQKPRGIGAVN